MSILKKIKFLYTGSSKGFLPSMSNLPGAVVRDTFEVKYPRAQSVLWEQIDVFKWSVRFILKKKQYSALFDSQGYWLETVTLVQMDSIPLEIQQNFKKKFAKTGIKNIQQVEMTNNTIYEIDWSSGIFSWKLLYDVSGKMVGKLIV